MKRIASRLLVVVLLTITVLTQAQTPAQRRKADRVFRQRSEVYFTFTVNDRSELSQLTKEMSIDNVKDKAVWAYANKEQFLKFLTHRYRYQILTTPSMERQVEMLNMLDERDLNLTAYPTYPQYVAMMQNWANTYPNLCKLVNIGNTVDGRGLYILKITDNPGIREYEPQFLYTSTMHGDETTGYILMLDLIDWLLTNYTTDPEAAYLINNMELWINPLANPDGTYAAGDNTVNGATRYNANGVDLNRNYPDFQDGAHPDGEAYQPETIAFMAFADTMDFVMAANFHGGAEVFNYPWDTEANDHPDRSWWQSTGNAYRDDVQAISGTGYFNDLEVGFDTYGVTNGFAWYEVNGGRQDYMNVWRHCREVTIELSLTKLIVPADFASFWSYNKTALINYMKMSFQGFHGLVMDACTGDAVKTKVFVNNHDADSSHVYTSMPIGNYYRPIAPGTYSVTFSANGYASQTINNVVVSYASPLELNVSLQPLAPIAAFTADAGSTCGSALQFYDQSGSATTWLWDFGDGSTSTDQNPYHTYAVSGQYTVQLSVTNCAGSDDLVATNFVNAQVINAPVPNESSVFSCSPTSFNLTANGDGDVRWFDSQTGGNLIYSGANFNTGVLNTSTTYYAENSVLSLNADGGAPDNTMGNGGYYTGPTYHYLNFDALADFDIAQVKVYANNAGNRTIDLRDANGNTLQSVTVNVPSGESYVNLGFHVSSGSSYQLGIAGQNGLFRNQAGASYPYSVSGLLNITGNSANNPIYYYYFYDWKLEKRCASARVPVYVNVGDAAVLTAEVSANSASFCEGNISFTANTNATDPSYAWFLNGNAVGTDAPSYAFDASVGSYNLMCIISTPDTCSGNGEINSNTLNFQVTTIPTTPSISFVSPNVLTSSSASGNQWYLDGVAINGANGQTYYATENGNYSVAVTNGTCSSPLSAVQVVTTVGISELTNKPKVTFYPNPANAILTISSEELKGSRLIVRDLVGRQVLCMTPNSNSVQLDVASWSVSWYTIEVLSNTGSYCGKVLVNESK